MCESEWKMKIEWRSLLKSKDNSVCDQHTTSWCEIWAYCVKADLNVWKLSQLNDSWA